MVLAAVGVAGARWSGGRVARGLGDVVADGLVVGVGSPDAVALGVGEAEADAVGTASDASWLVVGLAVGSANALVAGCADERGGDEQGPGTAQQGAPGGGGGGHRCLPERFET